MRAEHLAWCGVKVKPYREVNFLAQCSRAWDCGEPNQRLLSKGHGPARAAHPPGRDLNPVGRLRKSGRDLDQH